MLKHLTQFILFYLVEKSEITEELRMILNATKIIVMTIVWRSYKIYW